MSTWVKEAMKIVDVGISFDQSGHAALPWAIVKFMTEVRLKCYKQGKELIPGDTGRVFIC